MNTVLKTPPILLCANFAEQEAISLATSSGLGVEFQAFYDPNTTFDLDKYAEISKQLPISAIHAHFFDLIPGSIDPLIRKITLQRLNESYEHARAIGAKHIVYHNGFYPKAQFRDGWAERAIELWKTFLNGKDPDFYFYLENTLEEDPSIILEILEGINDPRVMMNLDTGHANAFSNLKAEEWVDEVGDLIGYVHLNNNDGIGDLHWPLGKGTTELDIVCSRLQALCPHALWSVENRNTPDLESSLEWLQDRGYC